MSDSLKEAINNGKAQREQVQKDIGVDIVFARLELAELNAGIRSPLDCPGIENVAKYIQEKREELS